MTATITQDPVVRLTRNLARFFNRSLSNLLLRQMQKRSLKNPTSTLQCGHFFNRSDPLSVSVVFTSASWKRFQIDRFVDCGKSLKTIQERPSHAYVFSTVEQPAVFLSIGILFADTSFIHDTSSVSILPTGFIVILTSSCSFPLCNVNLVTMK